MPQDYIASCLAARHPDLPLVSVMRRGVGESGWTDAHDRAVLGLLDLKDFKDDVWAGVEWTNNGKRVRKTNAPCTGRICKCVHRPAQRQCAAPCGASPHISQALSHTQTLLATHALISHTNTPGARRTHTWNLSADGDSLLVPEAQRCAYATAIGKEDPAAWDGILPFPWLGRPDALAGSSGKAHVKVTDFGRFLPEDCPESVVCIGIAPFDMLHTSVRLPLPALAVSPHDTHRVVVRARRVAQLVLCIPELDNGRTVEVHVQQKLPGRWRRMDHLSGPGNLHHQSGPDAVDSSGPIHLARPLVRSGDHSYLHTYTPSEREADSDGLSMFPDEYETELDKAELIARGELVSDGDGRAVLSLHISPPRMDATEGAKRKRAQAFAASPPAPRPTPR